MKTLLSTALNLLLVLLFASIASATGGACSGHGGVACDMGADTDDSVICLDGWRGSSVLYADMKDDCGTTYIEPDENAIETFPDIEQVHKNRDGILYLNYQGVIDGYPDGTFKPENDINRAELLKVLLESKDYDIDWSQHKNCFSDVGEEWFAKYVCYSKSVGAVNGYPDGTFKPGQTVNKAEAIKMIMNMMDMSVSLQASGSPFKDVPQDAWFAPYVEVAKYNALLEETGDYLRPDEKMSRAGAVEILYRAMVMGIE